MLGCLALTSALHLTSAPPHSYALAQAESLDLEAMTSEEVTELMNSIMASDLVKEEGIASEFDRTQESNEGQGFHYQF